MPAAGLKGSLGVYALDGDGGSPSKGGMLDFSTPAGWHTIIWWSSVVIILFFLWAL